MLRTMRENAKGTATKVILGLIIISFAFFGVESLVGGNGVPDVLNVNGQKISEIQFQQELQFVRQEMIARMGDDVDFSQLDDDKLSPVAIDQLKRRTLIEQAFADMDMAMPDQLVNRFITQLPVFQVDGKFSGEQLSRVLAAQGLNLPLFKERLANDLRSDQLQSGVGLSNFSMPFNSDLLLNIVNENREVSWLKLPISDVIGDIVVSDEQLQDYYDNHSSDFVSELQVVLDYIEIKVEDLFEPVPEDDIENEYLSQKEQFVSVERRNVSHILLEVNDEQTNEKAFDQLSQLSERLAAGEDFAGLAREFSQDGGSADDGGELGYTERDGTYPEPFEDAIFSLALNEVSSPVETDAGLHLIKVTDIESPKIPDLEELRSTITRQLQMRAAERKYVSVREQIADIAFNAADLQEPAAQTGLTISSSPRLTRSGLPEGILNDSRVLSAAFSDDVIQESLNSELIQLADDHSIVLRAREVFPSRQLSLDEVKENIHRIVLQQQATAKLSEISDRIKANHQEVGSLQVSAQASGYSASTGVKLTRRSADVDIALLQAIFEAPRSSVESANLYSMIVASGDTYLYIITDIGSDDAMSNEQSRKVFGRQVQTIAGQQDLIFYLQQLEIDAEIERL